MASKGHTSDIICHRCKGGGHYARECKSPRVMIATADGGYESASDYEEETREQFIKLVIELCFERLLHAIYLLHGLFKSV